VKNRSVPGIVLIFLMLSLALGAYLADIYSNLEIKRAESMEKAVVQNIEKKTIKYDDVIILEQRFTKCGHIIIASFENRDDIIGKSLEELRKQYTAENGYQLSYEQNTLIIKQKIDDWCPVDKEKCRLKEYKGRIAVYKGPNNEQDVLMRVTEIKIGSLPEDIRQAIENGEYEFQNMERLNDVLENLDEYL